MQSMTKVSLVQPVPNQREVAVELKDLCKWYGDFQVLHSVDLTVHKGERIVLCGPSGSGKSSLIRCISRLEIAESGTLKAFGADLTKGGKGASDSLKEIGMVFQHFNLFPHMTVLENCILAPVSVRKTSRAEAIEEALNYLKKVGIDAHANKYPSQLSGGQQQRVAIARALCMKPKIMLFDEPTSALDPEMVNEVLDVMVSLAESGMTMMCVTHEMGFARKVAERVLFLDGGRIVEDAPPERFFERPETERARNFLAQIIH